MNVKLLRKIQKHILAEPKRYDQGEWIDRAVSGSDAPPCGTRACIAGWACVLGGRSTVNTYDAGEVAGKLLGLSQEESFRLFAYPDPDASDYWPQKFAKQYHAAKSRRGKVGAASRRIDHFIKTGGAE